MPTYNCTELPLTLNDHQKQTVSTLYKAFAQRIADRKEVEPSLIADLTKELAAVLDSHKPWGDHQAKAKAFQHVMVHLLHADNNLLSLPWHIVPFNHTFMHLSKGFVTEGSAYDVFEPEKVLPLKILVVIAMPDDLEEKERLNHEGEIESLIHAFEPVLADAQVEIDFANDGTLATLKEKLANNAYHILHFSGHGAYSEAKKTGYLLMEDDETFKKRFVSADEFTEVLKLVPENCPELVLLSACESTKGFDSMTEVLQKAGVPSVVSMNQSVLDYYATYFAAALYQNIVKHLKSKEPLSRSFALAIKATQEEEARRQGKRGQYLIPQLFTGQHIQNLVDYERPQTHGLKFNAVKFVTGDKRMLLEKQKDYTFVGRRAEIRAAMPLLQANKAVLLRGQGGVGKTALAEYLTMRLLLNDNKLYPFMLDEKKTNITDLSDAMLAFLESDLRKFSIRREVQGIDNAVDKFWALVEKIEEAKRFPLFIFDNLESFQVDAGGHFQDKHADLAELINNIIERGFPVVLTSRYPVPDFPAVQAVNLNEVAFGDFYRKAQTLKFFDLRHRIGIGEEEAYCRVGSDGSDKANFKQVLSVLHTTLGGNYRALEFFDNIYQTDSSSAYATLEELAAFSQQMANDSAKVRERLQAEAKSLVFDKLIALLTPDELRTLQLLEPFRVPVLPEAVEMVKNVVEVFNLDDVRAHLERLFDLTLIEQHEIGDEKAEAYYVAPLVRDFLQEAELLAMGFDHKQAGDYFDKRFDVTENVDDAEEAYYHYYTAEDKAQVNEYGYILCNHYFKKQIFCKAYDVGKQTEDFVGIGNTEGVILNCLGQILKLFGELDTALLYFQYSLIEDRTKGNYYDESTTLNNIGSVYSAKGDYDTALRYLEQSLIILQQIDDPFGEGRALNNLAATVYAKGDYNIALRYLEQSLAITQRIGDSKGEGVTLNNISQIYDAKEDYDASVYYLEKSLTIQREIGDLVGEGATLNNLATAAYAKKDYTTALRYSEQSLAIQQKIGDSKGEGTTLSNMSQVFVAKGGFDTALGFLKRSLAIQQQNGDIAGLATTLHNMGCIFLEQKQDVANAVACFMQAYQICMEIGSPNARHPKGYLNHIIETIGEAAFAALVKGGD